MQTIELNETNFEIGDDGVDWCKINCPSCGKYHSNNFLLLNDDEKNYEHIHFEKDKIDYDVFCCRCREKFIMKVPNINQLLDIWEKNIKEFEIRMEEKRKAEKGMEILIEIRKGEKEFGDYSLDMEKLHGCCIGSHTWAKTKPEAIELIKKFLEHCKEPDSMLSRKIVVNQENVGWINHMDIEKPEVFGGTTLMAFMVK